MPLHIAIDIRRLDFFGIGTYIRNLVTGLGRPDQTRMPLHTDPVPMPMKRA